MMNYHIAEGTVGRLINLETKVETTFSLRKSVVLTDSDLEFSPSSMFAQMSEITSDYGFRTGTSEQRAKYVWIVSMNYVKMEDPDDED